MELRQFVKKIEPYIGIAVLIMLVIIGYQLKEYYSIQEEINNNCGWTEENYYCYCEYSDVMNYRNEKGVDLNLQNVKLDK